MLADAASAVSEAAVVVVSKRFLSLGSCTLVVRLFFFGIGATLRLSRFLAWNSSAIKSELSPSSSFSERAQKVLVSAAMSSGKGYIAMAGMVVKRAILVAQ